MLGRENSPEARRNLPAGQPLEAGHQQSAAGELEEVERDPVGRFVKLRGCWQ